jgi:phosphoesterase RecJ-like protein
MSRRGHRGPAEPGDSRIPRELLDELAHHDSFLVLGHIEPDGDCIASQLVPRSILRRLGKAVVLYNEGPFTRPEIAGYAGRFGRTVRPEERVGNAAAGV